MSLLRGACLLALHAASWLVPAEERHTWLLEWTAEVSHIDAEFRGASLSVRMQLVSFTLGAFPDAFLLHSWRLRMPSFRSPLQCLVALLLFACLCASMAWILPGTSGFVRRSSYSNPRGLVLVTQDGLKQSAAPQVRLEDVRLWNHAAHKIFSDLAFYQVIEKRIHLAESVTPQFSIVRASGNLFSMLGIEQQGNPDATLPQLFLSEQAWQSIFHSNPVAIGSTAIVSGQKVVIAGILPRDQWTLPGKADAWLLETDAGMQEISSRSWGFALGRMQPSFMAGNDTKWHMRAHNAEGVNLGFDCTSLVEKRRGPFSCFLFILMLAALALPATTSLPLGEYPLHAHRQSASVRLRRWMFLLAKLTLLLPALYFLSLDAAYALPSLPPWKSEYIQLAVGFSATLFAFRWILRDQRRRCPVCLEILQNPVHVGQLSMNFLGWNGTELICVGGHGLLHVPEMPTSWFSTQRWLTLDPSWHALFRPPVLASSHTP